MYKQEPMGSWYLPGKIISNHFHFSMLSIMGDIPLEKMGYLLCETKYGSDFSVSSNRNIEEFDSVYQKIKKNCNCLKKIPENEEHLFFFRSIALSCNGRKINVFFIFWNFFEAFAIFFKFFGKRNRIPRCFDYY